MIVRDKMFIISDKVDDSIKGQTTVYDIRLFKTFGEFERYVDKNPVVLDTIVVTTDELSFTSSNINRMLQIIQSPFLRLKGSVVYLIDETYNYKSVSDFFNDQNIDGWAIYQGKLNSKFITDIVTGEGRETIEGQTEIITYRMRANEYIRQQNTQGYETTDDHYESDDEYLAGLPDEEEPENINPTLDLETNINYIVGEGIERTLMTFLLAQYYALNSKTLILEKDWEYHTLTDLVTKSGVKCELILLEDIINDFEKGIGTIMNSNEKLIVVGTKIRKEYDYQFIMEVLESTLGGQLNHIIKECDYSEIPYGCEYTMVVANTVPGILKMCNSLQYEIEPERTAFVGMQVSNLGPACLSSKEMSSVLEVVLEKNGVSAQVLRVNGILLKGEDTVYDILSIVNRNNRR